MLMDGSQILVLALGGIFLICASITTWIAQCHRHADKAQDRY